MSNLIKSNGGEISRKGGLGGLLKQNVTSITPRQVLQPDAAFVKNYLGGAIMGLIIDATESRSSNWETATEIQGKMFGDLSQGGNTKLRLVHFGGNRLTDADWHETPESITGAMNNVSCRAGHTQIVGGLDVYLAEDKSPSVVIVIGDSFEESIDDLAARAKKLGAKGTKVFAFQEGRDETARKAFESMASLSGGAYQAFGPEMDLTELCLAARAYAVNGNEGLKELAQSGSKGALALGRNMKLLP